jgi:hypothetical protein
MKKGISILMVFLFSGAMALYGKKISHIITAKPVTKTIRFLVFTGTDYSSSLYKKSNAKVILTICRFYDDKQQIVWEGVIDKGSIKNYPSSPNSLFREVSVYNIFDRTETLAAYYKVIYDYKGSKMSYEEGLSLSAGSGADSLKISI